MIIENDYFDDIQRIWKENNNGYIINNYKDYSIFSCVDLSNNFSLRLHEKNGFVHLYEFEEKENNHVSTHAMMIRKYLREA